MYTRSPIHLYRHYQGERRDGDSRHHRHTEDYLYRYVYTQLLALYYWYYVLISISVCIYCMCKEYKYSVCKQYVYACYTIMYIPLLYYIILLLYTYSDELEGLWISVYNSLIAQTYYYIYNDKYTIYILIFLRTYYDLISVLICPVKRRQTLLFIYMYTDHMEHSIYYTRCTCMRYHTSLHIHHFWCIHHTTLYIYYICANRHRDVQEDDGLRPSRRQRGHTTKRYVYYTIYYIVPV